MDYNQINLVSTEYVLAPVGLKDIYTGKPTASENRWGWLYTANILTPCGINLEVQVMPTSTTECDKYKERIGASKIAKSYFIHVLECHIFDCLDCRKKRNEIS